MLAVTKKEELWHPASRAWKSKVKEELRRRGRGSFTRLAEGIGCKTSALADLLGKQKTSPLVAKVNRYFGWAPPTEPPTGPPEENGWQRVYDHLEPWQRTAMLEVAELLSSEDEKREALMAMLRALMKNKPASNDDERD